MNYYTPTYDCPAEKKEILIGRQEVHIPHEDIFRDCMVTTISGVEYDDCERYAKERWSNTKTGPWGGGIIDNPELCGLLGEFAVAKCSGYLKVDVSYREGGDREDFNIRDLSVNSKNSSEGSRAHSIRHVGLIKSNQLVQDAFIFTHTLYVEDRKAKVVLLGWISRDAILLLHHNQNIMRSSRVGPWSNYEILLAKTEPVDSLF